MDPVTSAVVGGVCAAGVAFLAPVAVGAIGFTSAGIAASSIAAKMMSIAAVANGGGVAAGGLVASLQTLGAVGVSASTAAGMTGTGAAVGYLTSFFG